MAATDTALEWWDRFCTQAGLELRQGRNKPGRDTDFEEALLAALRATQPVAPPKIQARLRDVLRADARAGAPAIAAVHFLETARTVLRDFADLLEDLLDVLARAQAQRGAQPLRLAWRLAADGSAIERTLPELRQQADTVRQLLDTPIAPADPRARDLWLADTGARLLRVLAAPLWRDRHALYPVWVGTRLLCAAHAHADSFHFHTRGGALAFMDGCRLATYEYGGEQFDVWAEPRCALAGGGRRKRGIQPDFRVVRATPDGRRNAATRFALECRHRLIRSTAQVMQAAEDYARGCPHADTLLVDDSPWDPAARTALAAAAGAARLRLLGHATAGRERQHPALHDSIRDLLFQGAPARAARQEAAQAAAPPAQRRAAAPLSDALRPDLAATVLLEWTGALQDVDLRLVLINDDKHPQTVAYDRTGSLAEAPYAQLVQDVVTGPGQEVIEISRWGNASYLISVRNFSQTGALALDTVACRVRIQGGATWVLKPGHPRDYEWTVGTITVVGDEIHMVPYAGETVLSA
ncbi:Uncharacterised protein [Bordetella ansorpii]|uniref:Uncharacterized protein n=1 Tax=Bordetella ansorpii TaxID=288768 RepID=A0A157S5W8_9BORD|nr:hypothetical protein [Bordetella ansorpii]SAI65775.1 Uncharacterised protein [Bordetella ansorpii]